MGAACVVKQSDPWSIHPPLVSPREVARRPASWVWLFCRPLALGLRRWPYR